MGKNHYYDPEVERHFGRDRIGTGTYTAGALVVAGLVGLGIGWLVYERASTKADEERRHEARRRNRANARRVLEMKRRQRKQPRPESRTRHDGMKNIPISE